MVPVAPNRRVRTSLRVESMRAMLSIIAAVTILTPVLRGAEPAAPKAPATYDVQIRYSIDAFPNERVPQYRAMMKYLKDIGFVREDIDVEPTEPGDRRFDRL